MTEVKLKLSLAEYLTLIDTSDQSYEWVEGEPIPMGLGTGRHGQIMSALDRNPFGPRFFLI